MLVKNFILSIFVTLFFFSSGRGQVSKIKFTHADTLRGAINKYRSCYDVSFYQLAIKFDLSQKSIIGSNKIYSSAKENFDTLQIDLFQNLIIDSVVFAQYKLKYFRDQNAVFVIFPATIQKNSKILFSIYYHGIPHEAISPPWDGGFVWKTDSLNRPWIAVACEGIGASSWWPLKDHLSDEPDSVSLAFEVPDPLICISNGQLKSIQNKNKGNTTFTWKVNYPINSYNVTFYIGHYSHFQKELFLDSTTKLDIDYYVIDYNLNKANKHFQQVDKVLITFSKYFGNYPFLKDGYSLVESPYWGMEHQGAIAYGNQFKNDLIDFDFIIVHETAHEWWGNSISVSDHGNMWIHEAFATYAESIFLEEHYNYQTAINYLATQRKKIVNKEPIVGPQDVNYNGWKDTDMYYKGTWVLHTLRNAINNDRLWFKMIHDLATEFQLQNVNTNDIIKFINNYTNQNWTSFFEAYLYCNDIPQLDYYIEENTKKKTMYYKWNTCTSLFPLAIPIMLNKQNFTLHPSSSWQSIEITQNIILQINLFAEKFLVKINRTK